MPGKRKNAGQEERREKERGEKAKGKSCGCNQSISFCACPNLFSELYVTFNWQVDAVPREIPILNCKGLLLGQLEKRPILRRGQGILTFKGWFSLASES